MKNRQTEQPVIKFPVTRIPCRLGARPSREALLMLRAFGYVYGPEYEYKTSTDVRTYYLEETIDNREIGWAFDVHSDYVDVDYYRSISGFEMPKGYDCGGDELLFIALAAINDENDLYQVLIRDIEINIPIAGIHIPAGAPFISLTEDTKFGIPEELRDCDSICGFHKASREEIIDLLKNPKYRESIHNYYYENVLDKIRTDNNIKIMEEVCENKQFNRITEEEESLNTIEKYKKEDGTYDLTNAPNDILIRFMDEYMDDDSDIVVEKTDGSDSVRDNDGSYAESTVCMGQSKPSEEDGEKDGEGIWKEPIKVYLSLPISGREKEARVQCAEAKKYLEGIFSKDVVEFISPFEVSTKVDMPYSYYMGRDVESLLECCAIILLDGWQNSKGCQAEVALAKIYGIKQISFSDLIKSIDANKTIRFCKKNSFNKIIEYSGRVSEEYPACIELHTKIEHSFNMGLNIQTGFAAKERYSSGQSSIETIWYMGIEELFTNEAYKFVTEKQCELMKDEVNTMVNSIRYILDRVAADSKDYREHLICTSINNLTAQENGKELTGISTDNGDTIYPLFLPNKK